VLPFASLRFSFGCTGEASGKQRGHSGKLFGAEFETGRSPSPEEPVPCSRRAVPLSQRPRVLRSSRSDQRSAEGVETPGVGSRQGSGTPCPAWARSLAFTWRRDLVVSRAMERRKAQEGFSVKRRYGSVRADRDRREAGRSFRVNALKGAGSL
jgi:hypothetical protein